MGGCVHVCACLVSSLCITIIPKHSLYVAGSSMDTVSDTDLALYH